MKELIEKMPDVWFDWFARLIPGCVGVSLYTIVIEKNYDLIFDNFIFFLFLGYIIGHIIQPISSGLINYYLKGIAKRKNEIVSKAYAEFAGFVSLFIISFLLLIVKTIKDDLGCIWRFLSTDYALLIIITVLFGLLSYLRKIALLRKINQNKDQQ
jgi:hypothetical protein